MPYKKMIISGNFYEHFTYQKKPEKRTETTPYIQKRYNLFSSGRRTDNISATKKSLMRRVRTQLQKSGAPVFISLTYKRDDQGFAISWVESKEFHNFILRMRKVFPKLTYVAVPEFQRDGTLHFHSLMWGVPLSLGDVRYRGTLLSKGIERTLRIIGGLWGRGFADVVRTDGSSKLSYYLSKYFTKAWLDPRFYGHRVVYYSHDFPHPEIIDNLHEESILNLAPGEIKKILSLEEVDSYSYLTQFYGEINVQRYQKT